MKTLKLILGCELIAFFFVFTHHIASILVDQEFPLKTYWVSALLILFLVLLAKYIVTPFFNWLGL